MATHISRVDKLADDNIRKWISAGRTSTCREEGKVEKNIGPYLVISRETGAGGSEIARLVAGKLGWDVLDQEIIDYMVDKYGTPRSLIESVDEKQGNWIQEVFTTWIERQNFTQTAYLHRLIRLLILAAHHGKVVIVGRGAQFILPQERGLSVRILAPLEFRIEQVILQQGLSLHEARKFVKDSDRKRRKFIKTHFHHKWADPHLYDLVVNVEKLVREDVANLIVDATKFWMKKSEIA